MIVGELYNYMLERELTQSMRSWSEDWAGKSHNFCSTNWHRPLPADIAVRLHRMLLTEGQPDLAARLLVSLLDDTAHG
ncbi:hypothetical protein [Caulobacter sp. FWC2]|uniref:hypothetical protein n=1 Tax=Caulobacter sp. FWC2 TaxID=69664 RepID=UPI000C1519EA|nr:hypothetical protein [Caulobacter sp. FWC2]PIB93104.1 hypothetical protein CSW62_16870 [Caulobacter sp. FWC2]